MIIDGLDSSYLFKLLPSVTALATHLKILEHGPQMTSYHTKSGPAIGLGDPTTERDMLIAANYAFAVALRQALRSGKETAAGVLATVRPRRGKNGTLAL